MYDFETVIDRRKTDSIKWKDIDEKYGVEDLLPMWVADMDFRTAPEIIGRFKEKLDLGIFGYYKIDDSCFQAIISWLDRRHGFKVDRSWIVFVPGVVTGLNIAALSFLEEGDRAIVQAPIYPKFYNVLKNRGIETLVNPLVLGEEGCGMDLEDLEEKIDSRTRALFFCNPHNPTGRVWTEEELIRLGEISRRKDILIVSDDIHSDIIRASSKYSPLAKLSEDLAQNTISFYAPSKSFNLAGLSTAIAIIPNEAYRKKFIASMEKIHLPLSNTFGKDGLEAAYDKGEKWLDELNDYIDGNLRLAHDYIGENIGGLGSYIPEGTYLMWLDFSAFKLSNDEINRILIREGRLLLNNGLDYGREGQGYFRMNVACPRKTLMEGLRRLEEAVKIMKKTGGP